MLKRQWKIKGAAHAAWEDCTISSLIEIRLQSIAEQQSIILKSFNNLKKLRYELSLYHGNVFFCKKSFCACQQWTNEHLNRLDLVVWPNLIKVEIDINKRAFGECSLQMSHNVYAGRKASCTVWCQFQGSAESRSKGRMGEKFRQLRLSSRWISSLPKQGVWQC